MLVRTELRQPSKKTKLCSYVMCWITDLCYISNEIEGKEDGSVLSLFIVGWLFNLFFWQEHNFQSGYSPIKTFSNKVKCIFVLIVCDLMPVIMWSCDHRNHFQQVCGNLSLMHFFPIYLYIVSFLFSSFFVCFFFGDLCYRYILYKSISIYMICFSSNRNIVQSENLSEHQRSLVIEKAVMPCIGFRYT